MIAFPVLYFEFFGELSFVIKLMVFVYMLYWLHMTIGDSTILFGISGVIAAYFILFMGIPTIVLVIIWVFFFVLGGQLQQAIWFGLGPLLSTIKGRDVIGPIMSGQVAEYEEQYFFQQLNKKMARGEALTEEEINFLKKMEAQQQLGMAMQQGYVNQMMGRRA